LGLHLEPLEACLGVEELPFNAQGPASIPGAGGVIKARPCSQIVHSYEITKTKNKYFLRILQGSHY
jgi:hypothetical protein